MKALFLLLIYPIIFNIADFRQEGSTEEAIQTINELLKESDEASGFHSLDLFSKRKLGDRNNTFTDEMGIHFEELVSYENNETEERFFEYSDLKKLVILKGEKAKYGSSYVGDYQILMHYKQVGRLIIVGISSENLKSFVESVQVLAPAIKKVKYPS